MDPTWTSDCGTVRLWRGDCLEVMATWPDGAVDAVVTDPPYGINHRSNGQRFIKAEIIAGDDSDSVATAIQKWCGDLVPLVMFFSPYRFLDFGWRNVLVWDKGEHVGIGGDRRKCWKRDFEMIGVRANGDLSGKRQSAILRFPALLPPPTGHVAEKPVTLLKYLIWKLGASLIADPCLGSGTTGVAAVRLGRQFWGVEIEEGYFHIARERIEAELKRYPLWEAPQPKQQSLVFEE